MPGRIHRSLERILHTGHTPVPQRRAGPQRSCELGPGSHVRKLRVREEAEDAEVGSAAALGAPDATDDSGPRLTDALRAVESSDTIGRSEAALPVR